MSFRDEQTGGLESPAFDAFSVTPSNSDDLSVTSRALYIGGAGNINVVMLGGTTVLISNVAEGTWLPIRVKRVLSTSTTATSIVAFV